MVSGTGVSAIERGSKICPGGSGDHTDLPIRTADELMKRVDQNRSLELTAVGGMIATRTHSNAWLRSGLMLANNQPRTEDGLNDSVNHWIDHKKRFASAVAGLCEAGQCAFPMIDSKSMSSWQVQEPGVTDPGD